MSLRCTIGMRPRHPLDPVGRVSPAVLNPVRIQLRLEKARVRLFEEQREPAPPAELNEFEAVIVIAKGEPGGRQSFADARGDFGETPETGFAVAVLRWHAA